MKFKKAILIALLVSIFLIGAVNAASDDAVANSDINDDSLLTDAIAENTDLQEDNVLKENMDASDASTEKLESASTDSKYTSAVRHGTCGGGVIETNLHNITETETADTDVVIISAMNPTFGVGEVNGLIRVLDNDVEKNSTVVHDKLFPNNDNIFGFTLNDLGITNYNIRHYLKVLFYDYDGDYNVATTLSEGELGLSFMDYLRCTDSNVNSAAVEFRLANDFNGTITAKLNGEDLGEIFTDSWQYNDTHAGYQIGTLKVDPSKARITDNKVVIQARDFVKGVEEKELTFDCYAPLIIPEDFYYGSSGSHPSQFFSIGEEFKIGIEVPKEITGTLKVYDTDENLNKTDLLTTAKIVDGVAIANLSLNTPGDNWLYLEYTTNKGDNYDDFLIEIVENSKNITVTVSPTEFVVGDANVTVSLNSPINGTLYIYRDGFGQSFYESSNNHTIKYLSVGTHIIRVTFDGDSDCDFYSKQFTVNVTPWTPSQIKLATKITSSKVSGVFNVARKVTFTLKDEYGYILAGKNVTVYFNGNTYNRTTDKNGQVILSVPTNLVPKTYTATMKFAGDENYNNTSGSAKVVLSKATPKITAKAKTFKKSVKTKKYTITLKNNLNKVMKNEKVTIKVNKVTYTAKTNSKGVATFKITKLNKKGTYTATVKFAATKYYNAKSASAKITVK